MTYLLSIKQRKYFGKGQYLFITRRFDNNTEFKKALVRQGVDLEFLDLRTLKVVDEFPSNQIILGQSIIPVGDDLEVLNGSPVIS